MKKNVRKISRQRAVEEFPPTPPEQSASEIAHIVKPLIESATPAPAAEFPKSKHETEETELAHVSR